MSDDLFGTGSGLEGGSSADSGGGPSTTPAPTTPASPEQTWSLKWNGREQKVPHSQALEYAQKGYDYTQKMQALAKEREEFNSTRQRYDQAFSEVRSFLQDRQRVREYLQRLEGTTQQAVNQAVQSGDPEDVVSAQMLAQKLQEAKQEFQGFAQQQIQELRHQMSTEQLAAQFSAELDSHVNGLKKAYPELRVIPRLSQILKDEVRAMGPQSIQEAKDMMTEVAKAQQKQLQEFLLESRKGSAGGGSPAPANPLRNGIEPAGGAPPLPPQPSEKYEGGIKNPAFKQSIIAELTAMAKEGR